MENNNYNTETADKSFDELLDDFIKLNLEEGGDDSDQDNELDEELPLKLYPYFYDNVEYMIPNGGINRYSYNEIGRAHV